MKRFFELMVIIIFLYIAYNAYLIYEDYKIIEDKQIQAQVQNLQYQVDQLTKVEMKEEITKIKINTLHNPDIINNKLEEVSKLLVYRGEINYADHIKESSFWGTKGLTLNLKYNFGITYDLENVVVDGFYENTVVIKLPKDKLELEFVELDGDSQVESSNSLLVSKFTPEQTEIIFEQTQDRVRDKLENDRDVYDRSFDSLKGSLENIVLKLGYKKVIFDVI